MCDNDDDCDDDDERLFEVSDDVTGSEADARTGAVLKYEMYNWLSSTSHRRLGLFALFSRNPES